MWSKILAPLAMVLFLALLSTGSSIKCHQCSSYIQSECADPFYHIDTPNKPKTEKFLQECPNDGKEYFCRKIYQNVRGDERVIRSCGWEEHEKGDCYSTVLEEYNTYVCKCDTDGCNSASMWSVSGLAICSAVMMAYLMH
uniref:T-complex protein 1 subunit eta n=1 Tax=Pseudodiaptomus poplesia TaxID=213370 RepID=A0A1S6GLF2_9MAXI|nr:t-complex protein 1 subunit eta [Pseudodiaptomus poplesia]